MSQVRRLAILTAMLAGGGCTTLGVVDDFCADCCVSCARGPGPRSGDAPPDGTTRVVAPVLPGTPSVSSAMSY